MWRTVRVRPVSPCPPAFMSEARGVERRPTASDVTSETPVECLDIAFEISGPCEASEARGVGKLRRIEADEPGSLALMVGADMDSTHHARFDGVAERLQLAEHPVSASSSEVSAVLKSEPTRADLSDDADSLEEEARPLAVDTFSLGVRAADVLAGWRPNDDVGNSSKVCSEALGRERADVVIDRHSGVVFGVEGASPRHSLARGHSGKASAVEAQRPAAGRGAEQVQNPHSIAPLAHANARPMP